MKPTVQAVRAIGAEFIRRKLRPIVFVGAGVAIVLVGFGIWLVTVSAWWWLLLVPAIFASIVFAILVIIANVIVKLADSVQSKEQKRAVRRYVDTLERVAENVQTPPPVIMFRVVRDVIWPRSDGFIATVSQDSRDLAPDFKRLINLFR